LFHFKLLFKKNHPFYNIDIIFIKFANFVDDLFNVIKLGRTNKFMKFFPYIEAIFILKNWLHI